MTSDFTSESAGETSATTPVNSPRRKNSWPAAAWRCWEVLPWEVCLQVSLRKLLRITLLSPLISLSALIRPLTLSHLMP